VFGIICPNNFKIFKYFFLFFDLNSFTPPKRR